MLMAAIFCALLAMICINIPIAVALAMTGVIGLLATEGTDSLVTIALDMYDGSTKFSLIRDTQPLTTLPADIRAAVSDLDEGETSTAVTRNGNATVLMLCQRRPDTMNEVDLSIAGNRILNQRLGTAAAHYLAQLRAASEIIDFTIN